MKELFGAIIGVIIAVGAINLFDGPQHATVSDKQKEIKISTSINKKEQTALLQFSCFHKNVDKSFCYNKSHQIAELVSKTKSADIKTTVQHFTNDEASDIAARLLDASAFNPEDMTSIKKYLHSKTYGLNTYFGDGKVITITLYNGDYGRGFMRIESYDEFFHRVKKDQANAEAEVLASKRRYETAIKESVNGLKKYGI
jgi:gas vesicle protein